jgi:hypothetical protein
LENGKLHSDLSEESINFAKEKMNNGDGCIVERIKPKLKIEYNRITFANYTRKERLTIDTGLSYIGRNSKRKRIENLIIAELKSKKLSVNAELYQHLKRLKIFPVRFSKYCMGVAMTEQNVKYNRFKKKLQKLNKFV